MIEILIHLLIVLLVLVVVGYIAKLAIDYFGGGPLVEKIVFAILGLIFLVYALRALGVLV